MDTSRTVMCEQITELCEAGQTLKLKQAIDEFTSCGWTIDDELLSSCLQIGAANGYEDMFKYLLKLKEEAGGDVESVVNACNDEGWNCLMQAARHGQTSIINLILNYTTQVNTKTKLGVSALVCASRSGHLSSVKALLDEGASTSECADDQVTPLMVAAQYGYDAIVKQLLEKGCNINFISKSAGLTALMMAVVGNHLATVKILLQMGADVHIVNKSEMTAFDIAVYRRRKKLQAILSPEMKPQLNDDSKSNNDSLMENVSQDTCHSSCNSFGDAAAEPGVLTNSVKSWWSCLVKWQRYQKKSRSPKRPSDYKKNSMPTLPRLDSKVPISRLTSKSADGLHMIHHTTPTVSPCRLSTVKQTLKQSVDSLLPKFEDEDMSWQMPPGKKLTQKENDYISKWTLPNTRPFMAVKDEFYEELKRFNLEDCHRLLIKEELNLEVLVLLDESDVNQLGISAAQKRSLLHLIEYLKNERGISR